MDSFFRYDKRANRDFSLDLRDESEWSVGTLFTLQYLSYVSAIAVEPVGGLLAVGTSDGKISLSGKSWVVKLLEVPGARPVKHLQFSVSQFKLLCIDEDRYLHAWSLTAFGSPKLEFSERLKTSIQCTMLSPSHDHAFMALQSGKIILYDTLCMQWSPYEIPNLWKAFELKLLASGIKVPNDTSSLLVMDIVQHPRDLNLIFIAYTGGVVLYDLSKRAAIHHYQLNLLAGSPGSSGYNDPEILNERKPHVGALAVHPSGHFFVVGHIDGCIAFWAVEDEDKPLMVRTLNEVDVDVPDNERLADIMSSKKSHGPAGGSIPISVLEPIFKLSWSSYDVTSDPRGGPTTLIVLGGLNIQDSPGINVFLFPAFAPNSLPDQTQVNQTLHPYIREQMRTSLHPQQTYFYSTTSVVQDYLLIPRNNPHFSGSLDPVAIAIVLENPQGARYVEILEFPPDTFSDTLPLPVKQKTSSKTQPVVEAASSLDEELASTLEDLQLHHEPRKLSLPSTLWSGTQTIMDGDLVRLEKAAYTELVHADSSDDSYELPMRGGQVFARIDEDTKFAKYQPHRILVTYHNDLSIRFQDISPQILVSTEAGPLPSGYPALLPRLTIKLPELLSEFIIVDHERPISPDQIEIQAVQLTDESAECVVKLKSGHIFVFAHSNESRISSVAKKADDAELVSLSHLPTKEIRNFHPSLMVDNSWGQVSVCEMSNIGFLAIAYTSGALIIVDMRGPRVILREGTNSKSHKRRSSSLLHGNNQANIYISLKWVYCGLEGDSSRRIRLLASKVSGETQVYSLLRASNSASWSIDENIGKMDGSEEPIRRCSFVIDSKTGASCDASQANLVSAMQNTTSPVSPSIGSTHCFWISVGARGAKCIENLSGRRTGRIEWGKTRITETARIIYRNGSAALVALTSSENIREALIYSLPTLEPMHCLKLPSAPESAISLDDTGDFIDWSFDLKLLTVSQTTFRTLFDIHRPKAEPLADFAAERPSVPAQPQPASLGPPSLLGSLFSFQTSISGSQIDSLFAGPDRPPPPAATTTAPADSPRSPQWSAETLMAQSSRMGSDIYSRLAAAVTERGEALSYLEDRFQSLEEGSKSMVSQAKKLATEQTGKQAGKHWFSNLTG